MINHYRSMFGCAAVAKGIQSSSLKMYALELMNHGRVWRTARSARAGGAL